MPTAPAINTTTPLSPMAPTPIARRWSPRLYLVGEAERSTRRPPNSAAGRTAIAINGRWHELRGQTATFEQLLRLAFPEQPLYSPHLATITYRRGGARGYDGVLTPGDAIPLADGLIVNANATYAS